jgi:hypothetical protein
MMLEIQVLAWNRLHKKHNDNTDKNNSINFEGLNVIHVLVIISVLTFKVKVIL